MSKLILLLSLFVVFINGIFANNEEYLDDNFIKASIVTLEPADFLYSRLGHAFIRLECPTHNLDFCFTYESENVKQRFYSFLQGNLKMGMMAIPTFEFLTMLRKEQRGATAYQLILPPRQKQRLWEVLDNKIAEGINLPYDYMLRGCAISCVHVIEEALGKENMMAFQGFPEYFTMTRRELVRRQLDDYPWTAFFLYFLVGTEADREVSYREKLVTPSDMVYVLQHTVMDGTPILSEEGETLLPYSEKKTGVTFLTPFWTSVLLFVIVLLCIWHKWQMYEYLLLALQLLWGLFLIYLIFISTLPCTNWNWLIVPFNPLPVILYRWRNVWALSYAFILLLWLLGVWCYPHKVVDTAHCILTLSLLVMYYSIYLKTRKV